MKISFSKYPKETKYFNTIAFGSKILYHCGDYFEKDKKHIIQSGSVALLKPKQYKRLLSQSEYLDYLKNLQINNEEFIYHTVHNFNQDICSITIPLSPRSSRGITSKKSIRGKLCKSYQDYIKLLSRTNMNDNESKKEYKIIEFTFIKEFKEGDSFHVNEDSCSLYTYLVNPTTSIAIIPTEIENDIPDLKEVEERKENFEFLHNHPIFNTIPKYLFDKNYFKLFQHVVLNKNQTIFKENEPSEKVYFIKKGKFELSCVKTKSEIKYIKDYLANISLKKDKKEIIIKNKKGIEKKRDISILIAEKGDMIGYFLISVKDSNMFTLKAISEDKKSEYFYITSKNLFKILKFNEETIPKLNKYLNAKRLILIKALESILLNSFCLDNTLIHPYHGAFKFAKKSLVMSKSSPHTKKLNKTFVETKIFPLSQYHEMRKNQKPHLKFLNNLVNFVLRKKSAKDKERKKNNPITKRASGIPINVTDIKTVFHQLNGDTPQVTPINTRNKIKYSNSKPIESNSFELGISTSNDDIKRINSSSKPKIETINSFKINPKFFGTTFQSTSTRSNCSSYNNMIITSKVQVKPFIRLDLLTLESMQKKFIYKPETTSIFMRYNLTSREKQKYNFSYIMNNSSNKKTSFFQSQYH